MYVCVGGKGKGLFLSYLAIINHPSSPLHRIIIILAIPPRPDANAHIHRRLRITPPPIRIRILQRPDHGTIDVPFQRLVRPARGVIVEIVLGRGGEGVPFGAVDGVGGVAFAVVVVFHVGGVAADEFEVDFVQVVGLEYYRCFWT